MPLINIPIIKGQGKGKLDADYLDLLPTNILTVVRENQDGSSYHRFFPGIDKIKEVSGISRGSQYNVARSSVFRVLGDSLMEGDKDIGKVPGGDRVSMAHSRTSQCVSVTGKLFIYKYDGDRVEFSNWPKTDPDTNLENPQFDFYPIGDVCRLRGRYIFSQDGTDTFWLSSIEDETKPDKIAPAYRAESQPDGIVAIKEWNDFVLCFGSSTIEFFRLTGVAENLIQAQPSYLIQNGVIGKHAITPYLNSFAFITSPARGKVSISIMGQGNFTQISDYHVDKLLSKYTVEQLSKCVLESVKWEGHDLLICHLPDITIYFDAVSNMWGNIKTGLGDDEHRAIDYRSTGNQITVGDKKSAVYGRLNKESCDQYGEQQEVILFSPMINGNGSIMKDLEITSNISNRSEASAIMIATTEDGVNYVRERQIKTANPLNWLNRVIKRDIGRVRTRIGFRIRIVGSNPVNVSGLNVRVE